MRENELVQWLRDYQQSPSGEIACGIGDDAAVLRSTSSDLVVTTDLICDGTHFDTAHCTPAQIGRKAMAVNLSDIAAMAANPVAAFVSLLLPKEADEAYAKQIMSATIGLANEFYCSVAGGDTNVWNGKLAVNVLVIGQTTAKGPLTRRGARSGDVLLVTGQLGGSLAGHHFDFTPRINEALILHDQFELHAGMDLSDGLAMDLRRLCKASGCGAEIDVEKLPISTAARETSANQQEQVERAIGDGEDFELLLAAPPEDAARLLETQPLSVPVTAVGRCTQGDELWLCDGENRTPMPSIGYEHQ